MKPINTHHPGFMVLKNFDGDWCCGKYGCMKKLSVIRYVDEEPDVKKRAAGDD